MTVQMTIRVEDDLAAFVDAAAQAGEGSRADIINRALRQELRRRAAQRDARIYATAAGADLKHDAYSAWATGNAAAVLGDLD